MNYGNGDWASDTTQIGAVIAPLDRTDPHPITLVFILVATHVANQYQWLLLGVSISNPGPGLVARYEPAGCRGWPIRGHC